MIQDVMDSYIVCLFMCTICNNMFITYVIFLRYKKACKIIRIKKYPIYVTVQLITDEWCCLDGELC